jgi:iron complex transport system substrate-binding protein
MRQESSSLYPQVVAAIFLLFHLLPVPPAMADPTGGYPLTVTDQAGRTILVKAPFTRIISLYGAHTENLFALGCADQVVGVSRHEDFPPAALQKPEFSYHDGVEKFLAASPDLVLIRPMIDRGYATLVSQLERYGITVLSFQPRSLEEMMHYWRTLGKLTGRLPRAERMCRNFREALAEVQRLSARIPVKKKVYFESIHSRMKTFSPEAFPLSLLTLAGGVNVAKDAVSRPGSNNADYGKEKILSKAPEIDYYFAQKGLMNPITADTIYDEPGFGIIRAVRHRHVHLIDEAIISRPTFRLLEGLLNLAGTLYPDLFREAAPRILARASTGLPGLLSIRSERKVRH